MTPRFAFIATDFVPNSGGIARFIYTILRHLPPQSATAVALPTPPNWPTFDAAQPFPIHRLPPRPKWLPYQLQAFRFAQKLGQIAPQQLTICGQCDPVLLLAAWWLSQIKGTPYAVILHGNDLLLYQQKWYKPYALFLLKSAQLLLCNSRATAQLAHQAGLDPAKTEILHPGIETDPLPQSQPAPPNPWANSPYFLTVGRLVARKGHDNTIRALPAVLRQFPDVHYLIIGDGPEKERLQSLATDLNVAHAVHFLGYIPNDHLPTYYQDSYAFVMPSRTIAEKGDVEGFGIVYLEANLFAKPVIAGNVGGVPDAVLHQETGLLVDPLDPTAVADAMLRLLQSPQLAQKWGQQGQKRVLTSFSSQQMAQNFLALVQKHLPVA